jgi:hypothetical protein
MSMNFWDSLQEGVERLKAAVRAVGLDPAKVDDMTPAEVLAAQPFRQKTEAEKSVTFEALRPRMPDAWTLLEIVESANPPETHDDPSFPGDPAWHDIEFAARDGWRVTIFYDGGELDYIAKIHSPDGLVIDPWEWPAGAPGGGLLRNWRGVGDLARLRAFREHKPIRTIDCAPLDHRGCIPVSEEDIESITFGGTEILGGYLDCDGRRILRAPSLAEMA